jgi:SsrA-binding protein
MSGKEHPASLAHNKKARHYYELLEFVEAGLMLTGSEIKSIRAGKVSFNDADVSFRQAEAFLLGLHIAPYANAGYARHQPERERKLLLHAREIETLSAKVEQKGLTLIPVNLHFRNGKIKVELAVGRGKKLHDQRQDLKDAAERRDLERELSRKF